MADQQDEAEKEHEPSQKRLDDARKKGDVAKSVDLATAASYLGLIAACWAGVTLLLEAAAAGSAFLEQSARAKSIFQATGSINPWALLAATVLPVLALLLLPGFASLTCLIAQKAVVFAPSKIEPKWSRLSPLATARQKFGPEGLFEFFKNTIKLIVFSALLGWFLLSNMEAIVGTSMLEPAIGLTFLLSLLGKFLLLSALIAGFIGGIDFLWQRHALLRRNRMTRKEMLDEHKENEGDPHAKSARKQRGQEIAMNQMLAEVPKASVVIVNPTHYAVALKWQRGDTNPPIVVAKGTDETARKIREAATTAGVPIHSDPPTARALHATTKIGQPIGREHYRAVAAAIRFAEKMRKRAIQLK